MGLFDFIFRRTKTPITTAAGVTGSAAYAGMLVTYEQSPDLQGVNLYRTYSNMLANVCVVGAGVRYYQNLLAGTSWTVTPKEGAPDAQRAADLVREGLIEARMADSWSTVVKRAALFRMLGFSLHEWTMRKRAKDGALVYGSIEHRPQATIRYWDVPDVGGTPRGVVQQPINASDYFYIDRARLFYLVDNALTDQPDGLGVLRHVVEHARRLARYEQLEGFSYETDLRGVPVGRVPYQQLTKFAKDNSLPESWVQSQIKPIEDFVRNHIKSPWQGLTLDSAPYTSDGGTGNNVSTVPQWAIELIQGNGAGLTEVAATIDRVNHEIARVMGMEFMLVGDEGSGSLALSRDKTSMFATVLESSLHEISEATTRDLVYPLLTLNGMDPEVSAPELSPDPIATERIEVAVDALWKLAQGGAVLAPDDPAINQIRQRLHLADQPKLPPEVISARLGLGTKPGGAMGDSKNPKSGKEPTDGEKPATKMYTSKFRSAPVITSIEQRAEVQAAMKAEMEFVVQRVICDPKSSHPNYKYLALDKSGDIIGGPYDSVGLAVERARQHDAIGAKVPDEP